MLLLVSFCGLISSAYGSFLQTSHLATHNSYHRRQTVGAVRSDGTSIPDLDIFVPNTAYRYPSLTELFDNGICGVEIDFYPQQSQDDNDFIIKHGDKYDEQSTCNTLRTCLQEINQYVDTHQDSINCPILVHLEPKLPDQVSNGQLFQVSDIIKSEIKNKYLYTPATHGAKSKDQEWPNWLDKNGESKIKNGQIFFVMRFDFFFNIFPLASTPSNNNAANQLEKFNVFPGCDRIKDFRYCVIGDIVKDPTEINEYVFMRWIDRKYLQPSEFNIFDIHQDPAGSGSTFYAQLPQEIIDDALYLVDNEDITANGIGVTAEDILGIKALIQSGLVPWKWWNAWMLFSYIDGNGNGDGKIDAVETAEFVAHDKDEAAYQEAIGLVKYLDLRQILGIDDTTVPSPILFKGLSVNNPFVMAIGGGLLDAQFEDVVPNINTDAVITATCNAINDGIHYITSFYPYQLSTNNGIVWPFIVKDYLDGTKQCP